MAKISFKNITEDRQLSLQRILNNSTALVLDPSEVKIYNTNEVFPNYHMTTVLFKDYLEITRLDDDYVEPATVGPEPVIPLETIGELTDTDAVSNQEAESSTEQPIEGAIEHPVEDTESATEGETMSTSTEEHPVIEDSRPAAEEYPVVDTSGSTEEHPPTE